MKKTVLIFGDSNTWGWKPSNDMIKPLERWDDDVRWPGVLQAGLGDGYKVIADGLNGRTTVWNDPRNTAAARTRSFQPWMPRRPLT